MRELKLKYFLELVSNIGAKSEQDAKMVEAAQKRIKTEVTGTTEKVTALERALERMGSNSSTERQVGYMRRLGQAIDQNVAKVRNLARAMAEAAPKGTAIAGGAAGAFFATKALLDKPMDYSLRLAHMSNTAFNDRDLAGRVAGKKELDAAINKAVLYGGGSRDAAAGTLDSMIASGALSIDASKKMLPALMKGASGSGASPEALANIAVKAMQTFKITEDQVPELLNIAMKAGQAGGFELKDMAKWLPQMMAAGRLSGLQGMEGFRRIVAGAQASAITSGSKDEAGNNVVNLLAKINSQDTAKDFQKQGMDLTGSLMSARKNGVNSLDAFIGFVDKISSKDPEYVKLRKKLDASTDKGEKAETTEALASLLEGQAVGKVIQDRQALMYLLAEMNNRKYVGDVLDKTRSKDDAIDSAHTLISGESAYKADALANSRDSAMSRAFGDGGPISALMDGANYLAKEFPIMTSAVVATTAALGVLASALAAFGLLGGRGAGVPGLPGGPGGGPFGGPGSPGPFPILDGAAAPAAAGSAAGAAGLVGGVLLGGAALSYGATNMLRNSKAARQAMMNDYGGDGAFAAAILSANDEPDPLPVNHRGQGFNDPRLLTLTAPNVADQKLTPGQATKVELGQGEIRVVVEGRDGLHATATVQRDMPGIRLNPGSTDPGHYGGRR